MSEQERSASRDARTRAGRAVAVTRLAWVGILALTAAFHVLRGAPVDAAIFGAGAAVLALDQLGWLRVPLRLRADTRAGSRRLVVGVLIAVAALTLAISPLYGEVDVAVVVGIGLLVLPVAWAERIGAAGATRDRREPAGDPGRHRAVRRAAVLWSAVIVAGCAWEIAVFFLGRGMPAGKTQFPALSDLVDPLIAWPPGRAVLVGLWLLGGYALMRRGWRR